VPPLFFAPAASEGSVISALLTDTFKHYQTTGGYITQGDAAADLISFSGFPDRIEITVRTFAAIINLTDEQNREGPDIRIEADGTYDAQIRAKKVRARNATAGSNALIQAIGKWHCSSESPYAVRLNR
jgi:hypothetical protein